MARKPQPPDYRLLARVGRMYYEQGLKQEEIAEKLHISRPKVSRLLRQAQEEGIVQISVISPPGIHADLEERLEQTFGLVEAVVVDVPGGAAPGEVNRLIGTVAAEYLARTVEEGDLIGVSWGQTLQAMANALPPTPTGKVEVVQIIGGLGPASAEVHSMSICRRLARALDGESILLPAPGIVDSPQVKEILLSDSHVQAAMQRFPALNVAYVGVGAPTPASVVMRGGEIISQVELDQLIQFGAVGDIALRFYDIHGAPVTSEIDERVIGISLDQLKRIPRVVGVAGGPLKVHTILGALRGELLNVLVTDSDTAAKILELEQASASVSV